ncbi:receptor-like protein 7 [Pistacia vera]|uniref:receptor-like protein 7 n=1 Tax=Pistacia vera TaxID=55513 RepID=UPI00126340CF|nr:receptor-like protein 7 [Pistacia vera]
MSLNFKFNAVVLSGWLHEKILTIESIEHLTASAVSPEFLELNVDVAYPILDKRTTKLCSPEQSSALLRFKNSTFSANASSSFSETDSCKKRVVIAALGMGLLVIGSPVIDNNSLFHLHHLQKLNLVDNYFFGSNISSEFGKFMKLTHLNLSSSGFCGLVPMEIFHLSKLVLLDLSYDSVELRQHGFKKLLQNLTELRYLHLEYVNMSSVAVGSFVNLSSSLISLSLQSNYMQGKFPNELFRFPFLQLLRLSDNQNIKGHLPNFNRSNPLKLLDLSSTKFSGKLPDTISNLMHLNDLRLHGCKFEGSIPPSLENLTEITFLDLSSNGFTGQIPTSISKLGQLTDLNLGGNKFSRSFTLSLENLTEITFLDLSSNGFTGQIPTSISKLGQLTDLYLGDNNFSGSFPPSLENLTAITFFDLSSNGFTGQIPTSISKLGQLTSLNLRDNKFSGPFPDVFGNLSKLTGIDLGSNYLNSQLPTSLFNLKQLLSLNFSDNQLEGHLPSQPSDLSCLNVLSLGHNLLSGKIPSWLFTLPSLARLDLSHNLFTSFEYFPQMENLHELDLSFNLLQGQLMLLPTSIKVVSVSSNNLTGVIPLSFCNLSSLNVIDLSNNSFSGKIPPCLGNCSMKLMFLNLEMNNFHGSLGSLKFADASGLTALMLNGNQLEGPLPPSFNNCINLEILDVGNNMINDTFPYWLLPILQVIILRSNRFHGPIDNSNATFPFLGLRILDLSHN